ncbi:MAG: extensin family protein [Alphaproteobacteria bacterium]|jgi:hypothetical protein|nr:extensin family protein [Rhodospirillaceae bacterium]MBT6206050.1 extensin family protein [Rhodospirillaceae bacterium]MBT6511550.1 extensin family protein [Rhodospirillaceae bacterium]MBT7647742.1 extensin family protein [Rhodospirillaceae bacterium]MDG2482531.1 extensin family protein [Alphaproteobacteria bacterium]
MWAGKWRRRVAVFVVLAIGWGIGMHQAWISMPSIWLSLADVDLDQPPGRFARISLNVMANDRGACFAALDASSLGYARVADRFVIDGCGLTDGVRYEQSHQTYSAAFEASCSMAAAIYWYETELDRPAREHLSSGLARINHLGTYACRNINNAETGMRSQHATANAIDIAGFVLDDGREVSVLRDWAGQSDAALFLDAAHQSACHLFNTVLGPDYNSLHADHFHLDMGRDRACR